MEPKASIPTSVSLKVSIIAITAALYAIGKALTGPVPFAYGVGEVLIAGFIPAFLVVVSDTLPVAIGAGIGTFLGDFFVRGTNPTLSLIAGVPPNFFATLLLGLFVKRYRSWPAFVAGTVGFFTIGNLYAAVAVVQYLSLPISLIPGFVIAWNITGIPAVVLAVPVLVRAVRPLYGRSRILTSIPDWTGSISQRQIVWSLVFPVLYVLLGVVVFFAEGTGLGLGPNTSLGAVYFAVAAFVVLIFGPLSSVIGGSRQNGTPSAT